MGNIIEKQIRTQLQTSAFEPEKELSWSSTLSFPCLLIHLYLYQQNMKEGDAATVK